MGDEFDLERRVWTVPAGRMKKRREHRVALSDAAMALLAGIPRNGQLVFPGWTTGERMNDQRLREALRATGYTATVHGFRHTFSTWARETGHSYEVIELSLAHDVGNHVERTYNHNDLLSRRAALMNEWADHCAAPLATQRTCCNCGPLRSSTSTVWPGRVCFNSLFSATKRDRFLPGRGSMFGPHRSALRQRCPGVISRKNCTGQDGCFGNWQAAQRRTHHRLLCQLAGSTPDSPRPTFLLGPHPPARRIRGCVSWIRID